MRLHPPITILLMIAAAFAAMGVFKDKPQYFEDERCAVAHRYIEVTFADGVAFEGDRSIVITPVRESFSGLMEFLKSDQALPSHKQNPLVPLYLELERTNGTGAADLCPKLLERFGRIVRSGKAATIDSDPSNIHFGLSVPAVSEDQKFAVLTADFTYGSLAGGGVSVIMLKDHDGIWQMAEKNGTWIS